MQRPSDLIVLGGGAHARVVIEAARSRPDLWTVVGFVDRHVRADTVAMLGVEQLGTDDRRADDFPDAMRVLGFGTLGRSRHRERVIAASGPGAKWATVVHRTAWISPSAQIGAGTVVLAAATVNAGARVGPHGIINTGAIVEHDSTIGAFVHMAPRSVVGGGASIGDAAFLGLGSIVRDHRTLGADCRVGMGAVVTRDFPDASDLVGIPARDRTAR